MPLVESFALSECGPGMDVNEDYAVLDAEAGVFVVCDGLGGRPAGDRASRIAAEAFDSCVRSASPGRRTDEGTLRHAIARANDSVRAVAAENPSLSGLASTLSALVLAVPSGRIAHVGDSRVYLHRRGSLTQLTNDQTLGAEMAGYPGTPAKAAIRFRHVLTRTIGSEDEVVPEIVAVTAEPGDRFLLATDGLTRSLTDDQIASLVDVRDAPRTTCERIIEAAMTLSPEDNLTIAVIRLEV